MEVDGFSFFGFFSDTEVRGEATDTDSLTAPITDTVAGSTKVLSLLGDDSSAFLASRFFLFELVRSSKLSLLLRGQQQTELTIRSWSFNTRVLPLSLLMTSSTEGMAIKAGHSMAAGTPFFPGDDMLFYMHSKLRLSI